MPKVALTGNHPLTEAEWLECPHPLVMLNMLRTRENVRQLRLFSCACCRRAWHLLDHEASRRAVEVAEQHADGRATDEELAAAHHAALDPCYRSFGEVSAEEERPEQAAKAARDATLPSGGKGLTIVDTNSASRLQTALGRGRDGDSPGWVGTGPWYESQGVAQEAAIQAELLRDIFGNPFRPVAADPSRLTPAVVTLARGIYDERAFDRMPILADALQDAGCDSDDILTHCRGPNPHARGCWVVDLVLGQE